MESGGRFSLKYDEKAWFSMLALSRSVYAVTFSKASAGNVVALGFSCLIIFQKSLGHCGLRDAKKFCLLVLSSETTLLRISLYDW